MIDLPSGRLSWSQVSSWHWNPSKRDYIKRYFFGDKEFFESDYLLFGDYISKVLENQPGFELKDQPELVQEVLSKLDRLEAPETPIDLDYGDFKVIGFVDDATKDLKHLREWKTGKLWTQEKVNSHGQLDTYASAVYKKEGFIPEIILTSMEVKPVAEPIITHKRPLLVYFTGNVEHFERKITEEDIEKIDKMYRATAEEISAVWQVFKKLQNIV